MKTGFIVVPKNTIGAVTKKFLSKPFKKNQRKMNPLQNKPYIMEKSISKCIAILCIFSVILGIYQLNNGIVVATAGFKDIKSSDWYYANVMDLIQDERGIIKGYPDGSFKPANQLTKAQFITMVIRAAGFDLPNAETYWAQNNINKAFELQFLYQGEFADFNAPISRQEMSLVITRVVDYIDGVQSYSNLSQVEQVVLDASGFSKAFKDSILKTYQLGIITGYEDFTFRPDGKLTRAEASAVIIRVIKPSARIKFNFETQYQKIYGSVESHLIGGSKWVNPATASPLKNAQEDWAIITSDLSYLPQQDDFDLGLVRNLSIDDVMGSIDYDKNGAFPGQIEDFKNLLRRRLSESDINQIMYYINQKTSNTVYMETAEIVFILDKGRYLVRIYEELLNKDRENEQAIDIQFNILYRSESFVKNYEYQFMLASSDHTKKIIR